MIKSNPKAKGVGGEIPSFKVKTSKELKKYQQASPLVTLPSF